MKLREFYHRYASYLFGLHVAEAYELERVLKNIEGFESGRPGPGGGADATSFTVTYLIVALMAGGPRRRADETAWEYYHIEQEGTRLSGWAVDPNDQAKFMSCPLTNKTMFGEAIKAILSKVVLAKRVEKLVVARDWEEAAIHFRQGRKKVISRFIGEREIPQSERVIKSGGLRTITELGGAALLDIAVGLAEHQSEY